jgi:hypothetical protein
MTYSTFPTNAKAAAWQRDAKSHAIGVEQGSTLGAGG